MCRRATKLLREIMNLKLTLLALVAAVGLAAFAMPAYAQPTGPSTTVPGGGCTVDCDDGDSDIGEPFDPFCHVIKCDKEEGGPGPQADCELVECDPTIPGPDPKCELIDCDPPLPCLVDCAPGTGIPGNTAGLVRCDAKIGDLAKVTAKQITSVSGRDAVDVVPVCVDKNLIEQQLGVENLRSAIAKNDKMDKALGQGGYAADDVVGVIVGRKAAVLYVHAL
jgi:hypothetical protein